MHFKIVVLLFSGALFWNCSTLSTKKDPYASAWSQVVGSEAWNESLNNRVSQSIANKPEFYAIPELKNIDNGSVDSVFMTKYPNWVSRAYFRLISEATASDDHIREEYQAIFLESKRDDNRDNKELQEASERAQKRFEAHRQMLEGLISWRAFHEFGSNDLDYFLKEQLPESYAKYKQRQNEEQIVAFLMNRLADLYHQETKFKFKDALEN
ncbi:MAG: hypothetical protein RLZZ241_2002 [Bacteroidota bacterium]